MPRVSVTVGPGLPPTLIIDLPLPSPPPECQMEKRFSPDSLKHIDVEVLSFPLKPLPPPDPPSPSNFPLSGEGGTGQPLG